MHNMYGGASAVEEYYTHLATTLAPYRNLFRQLFTSINYSEALVLGAGVCS